MVHENCNDCAYRCSCRGIRKAQAAALGYCFDYEREDRWMDRLDLIFALAIATLAVATALAVILHLCLWFMEVIA